MFWSRPVAVVLLLLSPTGCASVASGVAVASPTEADASWSTLRERLPGDWEAMTDGRSIRVTYRLTAKDSVLLETWMPGSPGETLTTYHRDGGRLVLTHYCGQGNQPRLQLTGSEGGALRFARFDVTDLDTDEGALLELDLTVDGEVLKRREIYASGADREQTDLSFTRVAP